MHAIPIPRFETFYRHEELTRLLQDYAVALPGLVELRSIGKSHEGRDIWLVVVTNRTTGDDVDKPAFWVDGNIHAAEMTAITACLFWLHHLATGYANDDGVTRLLDTRAVYIVPRLNPDGAELALADRPRHIRSSTRPYPYDEAPVEGLTIEDIKRGVSQLRNPVIARVFRELELVEQWGSGIPGIFRQAAAEKLPTPLIEELAGRIRFTVTLPEILPLTREQSRATLPTRAQSGAESGAESGLESGLESLASRILAVLGNTGAFFLPPSYLIL
jgi:hypothetical protein